MTGSDDVTGLSQRALIGVLALLAGAVVIYAGVRRRRHRLARRQAAQRPHAAGLAAPVVGPAAADERTTAMLYQGQRMEAVSEVIGGAAHDFNNLLTVVIANLELLDGRLRDQPTLRRYIERAMEGAERGAVLTRHLLAFARRQPLRPARLDIAARIAGFADLLRSTLGPAVTLAVQSESGLWPVVADPSQLDAALLNIALNARDAMPDGGELTIAARNLVRAEAAGDMAAGEYVAIVVTDSGVGMTETVRRAAFDPFFTTKSPGHGHGLGLSQVYGFVSQSAGHVTLASAPGAGTTVTLYLRRAPPD